ncbi:calcium-dependent phosphotriesterase [Aureobasidium pullulans]|nr:calcium-dependent phosphotriesterase [Aureobasidium pullulans]TIA79779.1 calcium-dependent phosphotriesterase [Aureobasidium pullulans]
MVNITRVNLLSLAASIPYATELQAVVNGSVDHLSFISYNESFVTDILGPNVSQQLVGNYQDFQPFHEAGVYNIQTGKLYATSNWQGSLDNPINVTAIDIHGNNSIQSLHFDKLAEANGGSTFYPVGTPFNSSEGQQIVFCDEGDFTNPAQLVLVDPSTNQTRVLINNFLGRNFTSINDVKQHPITGDLWFTDVPYGYWQYFRPAPVIKNQAYRFEPNTGVVQAVADDAIAPNGIEISPDFKHVYITDTAVHTFPNKDNLTMPSTIYRYDITPDGKRLQNKQLFAYSDIGLPDGIHCDTEGNVYAGCGDGVHVWNPEGVLLGVFAVDGGAANFAFVPGGMYVFNEHRLFKVTLQAEGREVKRDFGHY